MDEIKEKIRAIIENEIKKTAQNGKPDSKSAALRIWNYLIDMNALLISAPESVSGCCEIFDLEDEITA